MSYAVPGDRRRPFNHPISPESYDGWRLFARAHGVTVRALVEAIGRTLLNIERPSPLLRSVIEEARRIDAARRSRGS